MQEASSGYLEVKEVKQCVSGKAGGKQFSSGHARSKKWVPKVTGG